MLMPPAGALVSIRSVFRALLLAAVLSPTASAFAASPSEAPGTRIQVDPATLPAPDESESVSNRSEVVTASEHPPFHLPPGFAVNLFAKGFDRARWMTIAPDGAVLLSQGREEEILRIVDSDGDGVADSRRVLADGFHAPHGMVFHDGMLYVADTEGIWRMPYEPDATLPRQSRTRITAKGAFGEGQGHWTRNLVFSPDGSRIYVAIGSESNVAVEPLPRASIQSFAADGSDQKTVATGIRNPVGMAFYPGSSDLYAVVNERDGLGDGLVPDYLTRIREGADYGWPYFYIGNHRQPDIEIPAGMSGDKVAVPDLLFRSHSAPLGLVFYDGKQFPADYRGDAFVALHGSWNAGKPQGYMVVRVPFANGRPKGWYEPFLTGFWIDGSDPPRVFGRPVGLVVAPDGSLLVADDASQSIWRISWKGVGGE
jgi:glucose/arabinose dehydrogenase